MSARYNDLVRHKDSKKHKEAMSPFSTQRSETGATIKQTKINFQPNEKIDHTRESQANIALFVAVHSSFKTVDHLSELCNHTFSDSKNGGFTLHRTKCSQIISNVLAPHFINNLLIDVSDSPYSILIDETTDIAVEKVLGLAIKYFSASGKKFVNTFLSVIDVENGTAESIVEAVDRCLKLYDLNVKNLVGIGTDNAQSMTGRTNGVYAKLKAKYDLKNLVLVRCVCHSLQLAVSAASKKELPEGLEFLIKESHNWFANSSIRRKRYAQIYELINNEKTPLNIPKMSNTRWLSIERAVNVILKSWLELKLLFNTLKPEEKCFVSCTLKDMYNDSSNFLYLTYLSFVLSKVQKVNLSFESNESDPCKLFDDLYFLLQMLTNQIIFPTNNFDYINGNLEEVLNTNSYLGFTFEKACEDYSISGEKKKKIVYSCVSFTKRLVQELRAKLPESFEVLKKINILNVNSVLCHSKDDIKDFARVFIDNNSDIVEIETGWANIHLKKWSCTDNTIDFWIEVYNYKDSLNENPFKMLADLAIKVLCLPYSNAEIERVFSLLNVYKSKIRNKLGLNSVNSLLHVRYGLKAKNACCNNYTVPPEVLKKINSLDTYAKSKYTIESSIWPNVEDDLTLFEI